MEEKYYKIIENAELTVEEIAEFLKAMGLRVSEEKYADLSEGLKAKLTRAN